MIPLHELQYSFQAYLFGHSEQFVEQIEAPDAATSEKRLAIYANAYVSRLVEVLAANYEVISKLLGEDLFFECGRNYLERHPSEHRNVRWFGDQFSSFLKNVSDLQFSGSFLEEMANFEWAIAAAFDAADDAILSSEKLRELSPEMWPSLTFNIHPSVHRVNVNWNIVDVWRKAQESDAVIPAPEKLGSSTPCLIWRENFGSKFTILPSTEGWALDALIAGQTFEAICEGLCEWIEVDDVAMTAANWLKRWLNAGLITSLK